MLLCILIHIVIVDIKTMRIPQATLLIGYLTGLSFIFLNFISLVHINALHILRDHLIGSLSSFIAMAIISLIGKQITQKDVLGLGDAHLSAVGGLFIGSKGIWSALGIAFLVAGIFSFIARLSKNLQPFQAFPFAPFLATSIWCVWLSGANWWWIKLQNLFGSLMV